VRLAPVPASQLLERPSVASASRPSCGVSGAYLFGRITGNYQVHFRTRLRGPKTGNPATKRARPVSQRAGQVRVASKTESILRTFKNVRPRLPSIRPESSL
jgi:hypothetical protein